METLVQFSSREGRRIVRQQLNGNHGVDAVWVSGPHRVPVTLLDISSLGFAISVPEEFEGQLQVGDAIGLIVSPLLDLSYKLNGLVIDKQKAGDSLKLSAVLEHESSYGHGGLTPIELQPQDSLRGQFEHPFFYRQNFYFNIEKLSARGFSVSGIDAGCVLFSGMKMTLRLGVIDNNCTVEGVVSDVAPDGQGGQRCFLRIAGGWTQDVERQLSQYCFHYLKTTPRELRAAGLRSYYVKELVQFKYVETQREYEDVLNLRRRNYAAVRKVDADAPLKKLSYFFDRYSRILVVYHQGKAIGTATIIIGKRGIQPMEVEVLMSDDEFSQLPPYEKTFEVAALCLDKGYRDTDILHGMFENLYKYAIMNGRQYIVISSDKYLHDMYKSIGFQDTGFSFIQPKYRNLHMRVLYIDALTTKWGKGMNPVAWWGVWGNVSLYLYKRRIIQYSPAEKMRVYSSRWLFDMYFRWRSFLSFARERYGQQSNGGYFNWKRVMSR